MKLAYLAAAAALAMVAVPAAAADLRVSKEPAEVVRINVIGKTDAQVKTEIRAAAATVCASRWNACVETAVASAYRQYAAIKRAQGATAGARVEVAREDRTTIRVQLAGRSLEQIHADIDAAAKSVCKAAGATDYRGCIDRAARDAKGQLRELQLASAGEYAAR